MRKPRCSLILLRSAATLIHPLATTRENSPLTTSRPPSYTVMATPSKPVLATAGFKDSRKLALLLKGFVASSCEPTHLAHLTFCTTKRPPSSWGAHLTFSTCYHHVPTWRYWGSLPPLCSPPKSMRVSLPTLPRPPTPHRPSRQGLLFNLYRINCFANGDYSNHRRHLPTSRLRPRGVSYNFCHNNC